MIFKPAEVGWRLGRAYEPRGGELWVPWDRTTGVIGPQGSGKTLDLLAPALLQAPGAALVTLTKLDDLLLDLIRRLKSLLAELGAPLINYQHPHDFVMGLGATYRIDRGRAVACRLVPEKAGT